MRKIEFTKEQLLDIKSLYEIDNTSITNIAKIYSCSRRTITRYLKDMNVTIIVPQKYHPNELFFDNPNNPHIAYWLGFIYADGCVFKNKLKIDIKSTDENLLRRFSNEILGEDRVKLISEYDKRTKKLYHKARLIICNKTIFNRLVELGITPRKSLTITFPTWLTPNATPHFIKGFFDGDGSLPSTFSKVKFVGTHSFLSSIQNILNNELNVNIHLYKHDSIWSLETAAKQNMKTILDWMYNYSTIHLERKYNLYLQFSQGLNSPSNNLSPLPLTQ